MEAALGSEFRIQVFVMHRNYSRNGGSRGAPGSAIIGCSNPGHRFVVIERVDTVVPMAAMTRQNTMIVPATTRRLFA